MEQGAADTLRDLPAADRLELLVDAVADYAIYLIDTDGIVRTWNAGAERLSGYRAHEIIGQPYSLFFTPEDREMGLPGQILQRARLSARAEHEGWQIRKNGSRFWAIGTVRPVNARDGRAIGFARITRDISERREAQLALYESERRFRLLVDAVRDYAIYMLDPSGVVASWNAGAERLKGYSADEIVGRHFALFYTRDDRSAGMPARILEIAARDGRFEGEGWRVRKDGGRFWAMVTVSAIRAGSGELIGFAKVTRDISERQIAQQTLRESVQQFRTLINGVVDYALYMLDPNGLIINWNVGAARIKGYGADEIIGHHFSLFFTERDRAAGLPARALQIAAQEGRSEAEGWRVRKDGSLFWANAVLDRINDQSGELIGFAKITRDITERRNAQQALQEAQAQRAQAQKMEALGQLTGSVAHDFNNLLMIVTGHIQSLKKIAADDPKGIVAVQAIELAAKRGATLTRQLLTFSRRQTLNPTVSEVGERIEAVHALLASSLGSTVKLVTNTAADIWPLRIDRSELELALVNLALNARDAMPEGGVITISAENVQLATADTLAGLQGGFVAISIADTGSGIAPDILPRVFEPFFTTKTDGKGSGLGLSQVYGFAHESGGTITIRSELGVGTCVTLYLPPTRAAPEQTDNDAVAGEEHGGPVLLVEDNPDVAQATAQLVAQLGYQVRTVGTAGAALELAEQTRFRLIVSDIVMAGSLDGLGLARVLRHTQPDLPILLVTGYSKNAAEAEAEFTVLRKPYQLADLCRSIAKATGEASRPAPGNIVRLQHAKRRSERQHSSDDD